jgi:hypothetical protein
MRVSSAIGHDSKRRKAAFDLMHHGADPPPGPGV